VAQAVRSNLLDLPNLLVAAPPKGQHTRKLSGKRTGRIEKAQSSALFRTLESGSGILAGCPPKGRAWGIGGWPCSRNLSGTEDRGVMHRHRFAVRACMLITRGARLMEGTRPAATA
jgi:hypothetical protein